MERCLRINLKEFYYKYHGGDGGSRTLVLRPLCKTSTSLAKYYLKKVKVFSEPKTFSKPSLFGLQALGL